MAVETGFPRPKHIGRQGQEVGHRSFGEKLKRIASNPLIRATLALSALGGTVYQTYENVPPIHRTVNAKLGILSSADVPSTFDTTKPAGITGDNNILDTSLESVRDLPDFDNRGNLLIYLPPPKPGEVISYRTESNTVNINPGNSPDSTTSTAVNVNTLFVHVNEGDIVPLGFSGEAVAYYDNQGNFLGVWIYVTGPGGEKQRVTVGSEDNRLRLLQEGLPVVTPSNQSTPGVYLTRGMPLFAADAEVDVYYHGSFVMIDGKPAIANPKPLSIRDASGQEKAPRATE